VPTVPPGEGPDSRESGSPESRRNPYCLDFRLRGNKPGFLLAQRHIDLFIRLKCYARKSPPPSFPLDQIQDGIRALEAVFKMVGIFGGYPVAE